MAAGLGTKPTRSRLIHLGLDFGTCWSKLVLRDYEAPSLRSFVVRPRAGSHRRQDYRIPSLVTLVDHCLFVGTAAARSARQSNAVVYRSPKVLAAFPDVADRPPLPSGLRSDDLATLVVVHLLELGWDAARRYCNTLTPPADARLTMTMGVPMSMLDNAGIGERFLCIARTAYEIFRRRSLCTAEGVELNIVARALAEARDRIAGRPVSDVRDWIRSEAEAGLLWIFRSPAVGQGLYGCVDVGAGTTDVSFFRIAARHEDGTWVKDRMAFYSARSSRVGVDDIDRVLLSLSGFGEWTLDDVRGREVELMTTAQCALYPQVTRVCDGIFDTYRCAWRDAYRVEKLQSRWEEFGLFVLGGGSKIPVVAEALCRTPWEHLRNRSIRSPGFPDDLFELPRERGARLQRFQEDAAFLLVAYGLSFLGADVPRVDRPSEVPPFTISRTARPPVDQDEYYPK